MTAILTPGSSGRVVVSHAAGDAQPAESICAGLEERGVRCWLAARDAPAGSAGAEARAVALEDATAILALVSEAANESAEVGRELEAAFSARRPLVSLSLDGALPEGQLRYYLGEGRRFALGDDREAIFDKLAAALRRFLRVEELPRPATALVGRRRELAQIIELLHDPDTRLVTLTGPGGTGKTRLALETARSLVPLFADSAVWVSLAPLRDPDLALSTIAQALAVEEQPGRELLHSLADALAKRELLVVLDNAEQLLPKLAVDVAALNTRCPRLCLLVTSRERLNVLGEQAYLVPSLEEAEAVELFLARARTIGVELEPSDALSELCERLDRLPLALELAAARSTLFAPVQLLDRLGERLDLLKGARDADPRQQTLRATVDWSYDLLAEEEQRVFRALSVFAGGCTYEAAEEVARASPDLLQSLIDKSLLRTSDTSRGRRYWMLETIREYAGERLEAQEAGDLRQRHADFFIALAEQAESGWRGAAQRDWLERVEAERGNLRVSLAWLESGGQADGVLRLVGGVRMFWATVGAWREGLRWVEPALARTKDQRSRSRARGLGAAGMFAYPLGDLEASRAYAEENLAVIRAFGDPAEIGRALGGLAAKVTALGDVVQARELFEQAALQLRVGRDRVSLALALGNLADLATREGDLARAESLLEETLDVYKDLAREQGIHWSDVGGCQPYLHNLAFVRFRSGRELEAVSAARESLDASHRFGDVKFAILGLLLLGALALRLGDAVASARLIAAAEAERGRIGLSLTGTLEGELHDLTFEGLREALESESLEEALAEGASLELGEAVAFALERSSSFMGPT